MNTLEKEMKEIKKQIVERIYRENEYRTDKGLNDVIIAEAMSESNRPCRTKEDYFRVLSALNLLNAAIKDKRWKHQLSYGFIKGHAAKLFEHWITSPIDDVKAYYNETEGAVFFNVDGVVFSYHRIPFSDCIRSFIHSINNQPISWNGIRLQKIPVELFELAKVS